MKKDLKVRQDLLLSVTHFRHIHIIVIIIVLVSFLLLSLL